MRIARDECVALHMCSHLTVIQRPWFCRKITSARSLETIELAALLHDVADYKYSGSETANVEVAAQILRHAVRTNDTYPHVDW
jgi:hypothetical protein